MILGCQFKIQLIILLLFESRLMTLLMQAAPISFFHPEGAWGQDWTEKF